MTTTRAPAAIEALRLPAIRRADGWQSGHRGESFAAATKTDPVAANLRLTMPDRGPPARRISTKFVKRLTQSGQPLEDGPAGAGGGYRDHGFRRASEVAILGRIRPPHGRQPNATPTSAVGAVTITSEFGKARGLEFIVRSASTRPRMLPPASLAQRRRTQVLERECRRSLIYHREMAQCTAPVYGHRSGGHQVGAWLRTARRDQSSETVIGPSSR